MKIDPYKHQERYLNWKTKALKEGIKEISKENSDVIMRYIFDMENGINIAKSVAKGARSPVRLNNLKQRMVFLAKELEKRNSIKCITEITEDELLTLFSQMRRGEIKRKDGKIYESVGYFARIFKAFWNWWIKVNKKKGIEIQNIAIDLDASDQKPKWVYLTEEQVKRLCDNAKYEYKVLIMFLYDTGIRSPTELINVRVSDLYKDCRELQIRDEISKTFGRRIKLMLCSKMLKEYIRLNGLKPDDQLFDISPPVTNRYLQRLATRILGDVKSEAGRKYSELTMYDFRHCSCCYWLPKYKSESALKYRFGWKSSDKIHYYSELLGMRDTISEDDMLIDIEKTELERRLISTEKDNQILKEKMDFMELKLVEIQKFVDTVHTKIKQG